MSPARNYLHVCYMCVTCVLHVCVTCVLHVCYMCVTCVLHGAIVQILHFCKHSTTFEQYVDIRGYTWIYVEIRGFQAGSCLKISIILEL